MAGGKTTAETCSLARVWLSKSSSSIRVEDVGEKGTVKIGFEITMEGKGKVNNGDHLKYTLNGTVIGHGKDKENPAFELSVSVTGVFLFSDDGEVATDELPQLRADLAPLIFPYTREYMSDFMRKMGLGHIGLPLKLPPLSEEEA